MEVILKQDVDRIGKAGVVVKVKDGFARNFLLPNGLAVLMTSANLKKIEEAKQNKSLQSEKAKKAALDLSSKLEKLSLTLQVLTQEEDKLYGSISSQDIADALKEENVSIDKNSIILDEPIKALGIYEVPVKLHPEISTKVKIWVVKK